MVFRGRQKQQTTIKNRMIYFLKAEKGECIMGLTNNRPRFKIVQFISLRSKTGRVQRASETTDQDLKSYDLFP